MSFVTSILHTLQTIVAVLLVLVKTALNTIPVLFRSFKVRQIPEWKAPSADDVRSACPGLNTLANHGIIPRSGRGLTVAILQKAFGETYNIGVDVSTMFGLGGLFANPHFSTGTFDLSDINKHGWIEHDVSLSRADVGVSGDAVSFRSDIWDKVIGSYEGAKMTSIETAARARQSRFEVAKLYNPQMTFGAKEKLLSYGETALSLSAMGGLKTGMVPVEWLDIWFSQERLPIKEGWKRSESKINLISLNVLVGKIAAATKDTEKRPSAEKEL